MKHTQISQMTSEQALDESVMLELKKLIQKARKADQKAEEAHLAVFKALEDMCIDISVPFAAEGADNLGDAVSCYIQYGEFGLKNVLFEIRKQYIKADES